MSEATADSRSRAELEDIFARIERQRIESDKFVEEGRKLLAESRKLYAEELKFQAEARKLQRDTLVAPWVAGAAAGAGILAILQLIFRAAGWLP